METNTFIAIIGGILVIFGVYAVFSLLKHIADAVIFLIALVDAVVACNIHLWYSSMAEIIAFLPPEFGLKGWAISVGILTALGALFALPFIPFSSAVQGRRIEAYRRRLEHDGRLRSGAAQRAYPGVKAYHWDNSNDW